MFCPKCRAEYDEGFKRCPECDVDLVEKLEKTKEIPENEENVDFDVQSHEVFLVNVPNNIEASIVSAILDDNGIPFRAAGFSGIAKIIGMVSEENEFYVLDRDYDRAKQLIDEFKEGLDVGSEPDWDSGEINEEAETDEEVEE